VVVYRGILKNNQITLFLCLPKNRYAGIPEIGVILLMVRAVDLPGLRVQSNGHTVGYVYLLSVGPTSWPYQKKGDRRPFLNLVTLLGGRGSH